MEEIQKIEGLPKTHPRYGLISIHKTNCHPAQPLVASDMHHNSFITLRIHTASYKRNLNQDCWFEDDQIIEVALSHSQWAEFISSMNTQGVPCTLEWVIGKGRIKEKVPTIDKMALHKQEFDENYKGKINESIKLVEKLNQGLSDKMGKKEMREILRILGSNLGNMRANQKFAIDQFNEAVEDRMNHAKGELKSFLVSLGFIHENGETLKQLPIQDDKLIEGEVTND